MVTMHSLPLSTSLHIHNQNSKTISAKVSIDPHRVNGLAYG